MNEPDGRQAERGVVVQRPRHEVRVVAVHPEHEREQVGIEACPPGPRRSASAGPCCHPRSAPSTAGATASGNGPSSSPASGSNPAGMHTCAGWSDRVRTDDDRRGREIDDRLTLSRAGSFGRHGLGHRPELPRRDGRLVELDRVGQPDRHEVALLHPELGIGAGKAVRTALELEPARGHPSARDRRTIGLLLGEGREDPPDRHRVGHRPMMSPPRRCHPRIQVRWCRRAHVNDVDLYFEEAGDGPRSSFSTAPGPRSSRRRRSSSGCVRTSGCSRSMPAASDAVGRSTRRTRWPTSRAMASRLLDHAGWATSRVVGISFGGMVAQEARGHRTRPGRTARAALHVSGGRRAARPIRCTSSPRCQPRSAPRRRCA